MRESSRKGAEGCSTRTGWVLRRGGGGLWSRGKGRVCWEGVVAMRVGDRRANRAEGRDEKRMEEKEGEEMK